MSATVLEMRPRNLQSGWRVLGHNPFYPASAVCMMIGCFVLSRSIDVHAGGVWKLTTLIGVLNVYEVLLIAIGLWLIRRCDLIFDGRLLLVVESFFMLDAAGLNAELFGADALLGGIVNAALLALAAVKLAIVARLLNLRVPIGHVVMTGLGLVTLFALPGLWALEPANVLNHATIYAGAWWIGVLMMLHGLVRRQTSPMPALHEFLTRMFSGALYVWLIVHLLTQAWVYHVPIDGYLLSPLVLGAGLSMRRLMIGLGWRTELVLPVIAIWLAMDQPRNLMGDVGGVAMSPLRLTLWAAAGAYALGAVRWRSRVFATAAITALMGVGMGPDVEAMRHRIREFVGWVHDHLPRTATAWGVISVAGAFVLLGLGTLTSLLGRRGHR